jgi:mono/diheme cytochrome c family protein
VSFCSNSACHGSSWDYAGFDAPGLREILLSQLPPTQTPIPSAANVSKTYDGLVGTLLQTRCSGCHAENGMKGLNVISYQALMSGSESGPVINPGNPQESLLIQKQTGDQPHFSQLTAQELEILIEWIETGAPEN